MQYFLSLFSDYFKSLDKLSFLIISIFVGVLVFCNYRFGLNTRIWQASSELEKFLRFYALYFFVFAGSYFILYVFAQRPVQFSLPLLILIVAAPAIFALKVMFTAHRPLFSNKYYFLISDYPIRLVMTLALVSLLWIWIKPAYPFCGLTLKNFQLKPYLILLACMVPLIAFASTRPDFLSMYPKMKQIAFFSDTWYHKLLFELSYGVDFITIEIFFRGFLVLAFAHFVGKDAILPMAAFYCVIHFGKPVPECISSYFGGLLLGILVYKTQTIVGGLIVHLGIAWLMEAGGYIGNTFKPNR